MKAKCRKCGDTVEVTKPREFKSCKCGAIALDYGDPPYYSRVCGNPENFDGEIEGAPKIRFADDSMEKAMDVIGEENIGGESRPVGKTVKVKESFRNVNVDLCEDGTLYIDDAETDEQLAVFIIK